MLLPLPYVQPNAAFFFREKACACPTTRKARLVRTRRKKDAAFGKHLHIGVAFLLLRTCIRYLHERILYSVNTNTRRQAKLIVVLLTWLGNAVGVFNECKSSRADSECRFSFFDEAKKRKCPVGTRRMVKAKRMLTTKHKPFSGCLNALKGSLKTKPICYSAKPFRFTG